MAGETGSGIDNGRDALLRALSDGGVRFVLIGGAAIESHGVDYATQDIDVAPERERENLERLAKVLNGLDCRLELDPDDPDAAISLPSDYFTAATLGRATVWNLRTIHGKLDLTAEPAGFPDGYAQLAPRARKLRVNLTDIEVAVASLQDVEHSKRVADRDKDRDYLEKVGRLRAPMDVIERLSVERDSGYEDELDAPER
jgi:hypothetical protein